MTDPIGIAKARIRDDLRKTMLAKNMAEASVLRTLLAALDNAEAIPAAQEHQRYVVRPFGDPATEVPRRRLTSDEVEIVLATERAERLRVAERLAQSGREAEAARLRTEADLVARYLRPPNRVSDREQS